MVKAFASKNLKVLLKKLSLPETTFDGKVEDFLIKIANDFIDNSLSTTSKLKNKSGEDIDDNIIFKYSIHNLYNIDLGRKEINEIRKIKKNKVANKKRISLKIAENSEF